MIPFFTDRITMPLPPLIASAADLVTTHEAIREGFLKQALAKTNQAAPFIEEAELLSAGLSVVENPDTLDKIEIKNLRNALIAASGFSDKARSRLTEPELNAALHEVLKLIIQSEPQNWRQEIVSDVTQLDYGRRIWAGFLE
jgi:hypothetical protein